MTDPPPPKPSSIISKPGFHQGGSSSNSSTGRPSLLAGLGLSAYTDTINKEDYFKDSEVAPPRPRRLWKVDDTALKPVPFFYPPLDPRTTAFISDAPPSVVAVRIAECLRKRSISVEYDEEAVTAHCMTVDRCHFVVHLFRGSSRKNPRHHFDVTTRPDFSHGVLVECMRTKGSCISFHHACRAVLNAALSHSTGADNRKSFQTAASEFPRMLSLPPHKRKNGMNLLAPRASKRAKTTTTAVESLERVIRLLRKDRLGPQQLAMESLVSLTDPESSGKDTAMHCSLAVLGAPILSSGEEGASGEQVMLNELHQDWIVKVLQDGILPSEGSEDDSGACRQGGGLLAKCTPEGETAEAMGSAWAAGGDEQHGGIMRALCLRVFTNALAMVAQGQPNLLRSILEVQCQHLVSQDFVSALVEDLAGAIRPPAVVQETRLASAHEAALAIRCLGLLGEYSETAKKQILQDSVLDALEKARAVGRSTHDVLAEEADRAYARLTEDVRSC